MHKPCTLFCLILAVLVFSTGCGGGPKRPPLGTVRGKITYKGVPVKNAMVAFLGDGAPRMAKGTTDDNGNYQLTSYEENDGAIIGSHIITVIPMGEFDETSAVVPEDYDAKNESLDKAREISAQQQEQLEKKPPIPAKYGRRNTTDLRKEVKEGENVIDLELVD
jgi:hypothetical protein